jgi:hypothetical protein
MKNRNKLMIVAVSLMSFSACTKLEEKLNSETTAGGGGGGSVNVASLLTGAYRSFEGIFMDQARMWAALLTKP